MKIIVTGASGQLGRAVTAELVGRVDPSDLILVTRSAADLSESAPAGADVRYGDFTDATSLEKSFSGGNRMLLISTDKVGDRVEGHKTAVDAAVRADIELVAYTSIINPTRENPAVVAPEHRATEEHLLDSGIGWTFLRNSIYAEIQKRAMTAAAQSGSLVTNEGKGRTAYVSRQDCAAAAAAVLTGDGHASRAYEITGPELLDAEDRARIYSEVTGARIEVVHVDDDRYAAGMAEATGMPIETARSFATFGQATREGLFDVQSDDLQHLIGRQPRTLHEVLSQ